MLRQGNGISHWNNGLGNVDIELPEASILQTIAEVAVSSSEAGMKRCGVLKVVDISGKSHPILKDAAVINYSAQLNGTGYGQGNQDLPLSVLMKKTEGPSSTELQAYSTLFKDLQPESGRNIHNIFKGPRQDGNLYSLIPRPFLIQKPYLFLENVEHISAGEFQHVQHTSGGRNKQNALNLDFNHCLLAVETLARFHATSYILRKQLGVKGKGKLEMLQKYPFLNQSNSQYSSRTSPQLAPVYEQAFDLAVKVIQQENPSLAFKLQRKVINPEGIFEKVVKLLEDERYENDDLYVACHGNFLADNLLFSYDKSGSQNEPTSCRITNFNSMFLGPLASDLALFLLTCTTLEFRLEYEEKLLAFYCDAFQEQLVARCGRNSVAVEEFGENIDEFHRSVERQYKKMLEFAFYNVCVLLPLFLFTSSAINSTDECPSIKDLLDRSKLKNKYYSIDGTHKIDSEFETFVIENVVLGERLVEILKQFAKYRVLL